MINTNIWHSSNNDKRRFGILLLPSWGSALICIAVSLAVIIGAFVYVRFGGSLLEQDLNTLRAINIKGSSSYHGIATSLTLDDILSEIVTFSVWAIIGMGIYFTIASIVSVIRSTEQLRQDLQYVNSSRRQIIQTVALRLCVRILVLGIWLLYVRFFFATIVPHCLLWTHATMQSVTLSTVYGVSLALVVMIAALHANIVLLRLLALRPRLFGGETYQQ